MQIGDNILDSREVTARRDELQSEHDDLEEVCNDAKAALDDLDADATEAQRLEAIDAFEHANEAWSDWRDEYLEELDGLKELCAEGENYAEDWLHGATLILDSYFPQYAEELAADLHGKRAIDNDWPFNCIDWDKAADLLKSDYTEITVKGESYWVR